MFASDARDEAFHLGTGSCKAAGHGLRLSPKRRNWLSGRFTARNSLHKGYQIAEDRRPAPPKAKPLYTFGLRVQVQNLGAVASLIQVDERIRSQEHPDINNSVVQ